MRNSPKQYVEPKLDLLWLEAKDVITFSAGGNQLPDEPSPFDMGL